MDKFFNRLNGIFDSLDRLFDDLFHETERDSFYDPDFKNAWIELEQYLSGRKSSFKNFNNFKKRDKVYRNTEYLAEDYANLKVNYDAPLESVTKSYKRLMKKYHPDNFPENSEQHKLATEITKKLNNSYQRIKSSLKNKDF